MDEKNDGEKEVKVGEPRTSKEAGLPSKEEIQESESNSDGKEEKESQDGDGEEGSDDKQ